MTKAPLILASASSARIAVLQAAGLRFEALAADIDEATIRDCAVAAGRTPEAIATELGIAKAHKISALRPDALVLGADQVLVHGDRLLAKPGSRTGARQQLMDLRGSTHSLISAAALVCSGDLIWEDSQIVDLSMRSFSDAFLDDYLDRVGDQVMSSVGAYHLEGLGAQLFSRIDGDYFTVLGLPLLPVLQALRQAGHLPE